MNIISVIQYIFLKSRIIDKHRNTRKKRTLFHCMGRSENCLLLPVIHTLPHYSNVLIMTIISALIYTTYSNTVHDQTSLLEMSNCKLFIIHVAIFSLHPRFFFSYDIHTYKKVTPNEQPNKSVTKLNDQQSV